VWTFRIAAARSGATLTTVTFSFCFSAGSGIVSVVMTLQRLEGLVDVYLPDMKYMEPELGSRYSGASDYPEVATAALKEMFLQKGADIDLDSDELITSGMIVRHLVLPGHVGNSKKVLRFIAEELSPDVHISLMAQYWPTPKVRSHPNLSRRITQEEYDEVLDEFDRLGFWRGWVQELESADTYRPDFSKDHPFED